MTAKPTILIADDDLSSIAIINTILEETFRVSFARSGQEALDTAAAIRPDLILLDIIMPGMDGFEVCERLKADPDLSDIPVIFMTALGATEDEVRGLTLGAIDYVTKPAEPIALRARVNNHVELKRLRDSLAENALTDPLTGLGNRQRLEATLRSEVSRLGVHGEWLSMVILDVGGVKRFNEAHGRAAGDHCIGLVAEALTSAALRPRDLLARYGGVEFAYVLPDTDVTAARTIAERVLSAIAALTIPGDQPEASPPLTANIGIATGRCQPGMSPDLWVACADGQLYRSKLAGPNKITATIFNSNAAALTMN